MISIAIFSIFNDSGFLTVTLKFVLNTKFTIKNTIFHMIYKHRPILNIIIAFFKGYFRCAFEWTSLWISQLLLLVS